jgi:hypothetical protein
MTAIPFEEPLLASPERMAMDLHYRVWERGQ